MSDQHAAPKSTFPEEQTAGSAIAPDPSMEPLATTDPVRGQHKDDGCVEAFFPAHTATGADNVSFEHSQDLLDYGSEAAGWRTESDGDGTRYFWNAQTRASSWKRPVIAPLELLRTPHGLFRCGDLRCWCEAGSATLHLPEPRLLGDSGTLYIVGGDKEPGVYTDWKQAQATGGDSQAIRRTGNQAEVD